MRPLSIRHKMLLLGVVPSVLITLVLTTYLTHARIRDMETALVEYGRALTEHLAMASAFGVFSGTTAPLEQLLRPVVDDPRIGRIRIQDSLGTVLVDHRGSAAGSPTPELVFSRDILGTDLPMTDTTDWLLQPQPDAAPLLIGRVDVEMSREPMQARRNQVLLVGTSLAALCLLATLLLARRLAQELVRPVQALQRAVERIARGDFSARASTPGQGELARLTQGVHAMAAALAGAQQALEEEVQLATADLRQSLDDLEIKNIQLELARRRADRNTEAKGRFLANLSHEIRTPMNAVLGFTDLLSRTPLSPQQRDYVQTLGTSARHLLGLIDDVLDYSRIEAGKLTLREQPFDLRRTIEDLVCQHSAAADAKGLRYVLELRPEVPTAVIGDATRLTQIVTNLISNAIKFTDSGRVVIDVSAARDREQVILAVTVRDSGRGIAPADRERLFNAFERLESNAVSPQAGSGLGLSISMRLTTLMGGTLAVASEPERGSTFRLRLPLQLAAEPPQSAPAPAGPILLIVRDTLHARAIRHLLEYLGAEVVHRRERVTAQAWVVAHPERAARLAAVLWVVTDGPLRPAALANWAREAGLPARCRRIMLGQMKPFPSNPEDPLAPVQLPLPATGRDLFPALQPAPPEALPDDGATRRVLLVDDNLINRKLASVLLADLGCSVDQAVDGLEAVAACQQQRYQLILMDVHMPQLNGLDASRQIRSGGPNAGVPILALTADAGDADPAAYAAAGMDGYLAKPITAEMLAAALSRWVARRQRVSA